MLIKQLSQPFQYKKIQLHEKTVQQKSKPKHVFKTLKRIWNYLAKEKVILLCVVLFVLISSALGLLGPYMVGMAIDDYIVTQQYEGLKTLLLGLFCIYVMYSLAIFLQNFLMVGVAQKTVYTLREELFNQFHYLPISFFDKRQHGELMSRVTNDIDNINNTLNSSFVQIISSIVTLTGTVTVMLMLSPILTVITMTIIPLMFFGMRWITNRTGPLYKIQQHDLGDVNGYVEEIISGQHIVKTFSQEHRVIQTFKQKNKALQLSGFWSMTFSGFIPKVMNMLNFLSFGLIALFGGLLALHDILTVGVIVIFIEYARQFTRPLNELSNQFNVLLSAVAGAERVFAIIDHDKEEIDETKAIELEDTKGHFKFNQVSFSYDDSPTLTDISFEAKPGQTVAFVGHTGAGKTTIMNLLTRFYNYNQGEILLDGIELKNIKRTSLRSHMAFVLQDTFLFQGSIRENIRYGRLDATDEEVIVAAKRANAHEFIQQLPEGYDTILDQSGAGISQGQKQLLAIARAFLAEPAILILDEATSNIDTITELKIQEALKTLMEGRTSFVIAHRLNTVQEADQIIMLQNGRVIERGTHEELIKRKQHYYQLYKNQLKKLVS